METEAIVSFLFTLHIALLGVKLIAVGAMFYLVNKHDATMKYLMPLLVFSFILLLSQAWFIYCFFTDIDLYYYEYLAVLDEIVFTLIGVHYIIKEAKRHG